MENNEDDAKNILQRRKMKWESGLTWLKEGFSSFKKSEVFQVVKCASSSFLYK